MPRILAHRGSRVDMCRTCKHACYMSKMIQIRNVPDAVHRRLKARAALEGRTLSEYLLAQLDRVAARPSRSELLARLAQVKREDLKPRPAEIIRAERSAR